MVICSVKLQKREVEMRTLFKGMCPGTPFPLYGTCLGISALRNVLWGNSHQAGNS